MWCDMDIVLGHSGIFTDDFTDRLFGQAMMQFVDEEKTA